MNASDSRVLGLVEKIQRLNRGEPITIGGSSDVSYLKEQIDVLQADQSLPRKTIRNLVIASDINIYTNLA